MSLFILFAALTPLSAFASRVRADELEAISGKDLKPKLTVHLPDALPGDLPKVPISSIYSLEPDPSPKLRRMNSAPELFSGLPGEKIKLNVKSMVFSRHKFNYTITGTPAFGMKDQTLGTFTRKGAAQPARLSLYFLSKSTGWKYMEVREAKDYYNDGVGLQAHPEFRKGGMATACPEACELCTSLRGDNILSLQDREFKCRMAVSMEHTKHGSKGTCKSDGVPTGDACKADAKCSGDYGEERCLTADGYLLGYYGYCRCGTKAQLEKQVRQALHGYECRDVRMSRSYTGFISAICALPRYYKVSFDNTGPRNDRGFSIHQETKVFDPPPQKALKQHEKHGEADFELNLGVDGDPIMEMELAEEEEDDDDSPPQLGPIKGLYWMDSKLLERTIAHPFREDLKDIPIWRADCRDATKCEPTSMLRWNSANYHETGRPGMEHDMELEVKCTQEICRNDGVLPVVLLVVLAHARKLELEIPDMLDKLDSAEKWEEQQTWGLDKHARCEATPSTESTYSALAGPSLPHYDPLAINESNFPKSIKPCTLSMIHDRCKCDSATLGMDGDKQAWCYVDTCTDCAAGSDPGKSCAEVSSPWAQCKGDGYSPNRPVNGYCPTVHECTGRPYRGYQDLKVYTLEESIGRNIEGIMSRMYEPMLGQSNMRENSHRVTYTHCVPLGEYSRWFLTDLYVQGKDAVHFRHDIPLNEQTVGFSTDIFYSTDPQDFHLKLDMQLYSAWNAAYIDGVIWFDMLQPYGDRESFPMQLPFVSIQRRFKTCFNRMPALFGTFTVKVCLAYTQDREIFLSIRGTLFGVSLPFSREVHLADVHVSPDEEGNNLFSGLTVGNLTVKPEEVTYYMRETEERTTWDLTKMVVELERRTSESEERRRVLENTTEVLEARVEALEQNVNLLQKGRPRASDDSQRRRATPSRDG